MSVPLLTTKLFIPKPRPGIIHRARLLDKIDRSLDHSFVLVSAPAGFGKTTLLSSWVDQNAIPAAWLSLDQGDNEPARFLAYVLTALQSVHPDIGAEILNDLGSPHPDTSEAALVSIINEVSAANCGDFVLVLDDYHLVTTSAVHAITRFLLDHMPPGMHIVIATRADPDLPLPRMRGRGELVEIRQEDLRFTTSEVVVFTNQVRNLALTPEDIGALTARTEGWIAGLQMAAISMSGRSDRSRFVKQFSGSDRYILDYLMDEVIKGQPAEIRDFLLRTSLVERLTAPLCTALTGVQDSQGILERLERENLFIIPLDNERNWYRYHHLFAGLLQKRLADLHSDQISALHKKASGWYAANGFIDDGIEHALAAQDFDTAVDMIALVAEPILMRSDLTKLKKWLQTIPDEIIRQNPVLSIYYAYVLILYGYPMEMVESYCGTFEDASDENKGYVAAFRSLIAVARRNVPAAEKLSQIALQNLPEDDRFLRGMAIWVRSAADLMAGDLVSGVQRLEEVARQSREAGNIMGSTLAACDQGNLHVYRGELTNARKVYLQVLEEAKNREGNQLPIAGEAFFGLGELLYEWNRLDEALEHIEKGLALSEKWGTIVSVNGLIAKAKIFRAKGDSDGALDILLGAHELAVSSDATVLDDYEVAAHLADLRLAQGNMSAALDWVVERKLGEIGSNDHLIITDTLAELDKVPEGKLVSIYYRKTAEFFTLAHVLIANGQYTQSLELLSRLLEYSRQRGLSGREIQVQILIAVVHHKLGDRQSALDVLDAALQLAEPEGYCRSFLDRGLTMRKLLQQAAQQNIKSRYVGALLAAFDFDSQDPLPTGESLVDPLSVREMDVLRLLQTKLTAPEIADHLFISTSTVRTHIKHIYAKLDVNRRFEAVERAKELGIL